LSIGINACVVIQQVEDFANFTFRKNEERQRKLVYVGVDDSELKV
jgi:ATP-dependent RNA helicase DDX18/HAS1